MQTGSDTNLQPTQTSYKFIITCSYSYSILSSKTEHQVYKDQVDKLYTAIKFLHSSYVKDTKL